MAAARPRARPPATHTGGEREAQRVRRPPPARPTERQSTSNQRASQSASQPVLSLGGRCSSFHPSPSVCSLDSSSLLALGRGRAVPLFVWGGPPEARMHVRSPEPARHGPAGARSFCVFGCTFWLCTFRARLRAFGSHTPLPLVAAQRGTAALWRASSVGHQGHTKFNFEGAPPGPWRTCARPNQPAGLRAPRAPNAHGRACARTQAI